MKADKTANQAVEIPEHKDLDQRADDRCAALSNAIFKGRSYEEIIALAKKLTAQVEAMGIAKNVAAEFAGMSENTLGELSCELTNKLNDAIAKGRTPAEEIGLIKQLTYQVETSDSPEQKISEEAKPVDFAAEDEIVLTHAEHFFRNIRRAIYKHICFLDAIAEIGDMFSYDETKQLKEMKEVWFDSYKNELTDCGPETIKLK
jgi:hypothetical protein